MLNYFSFNNGRHPRECGDLSATIYFTLGPASYRF